MNVFLNTFMGLNRHLQLFSGGQITEIFERTIQIVDAAIGERAFKPQKALNAAVFDSVMVGLARRVVGGTTPRTEAVREAYDALLARKPYEAATSRATADEERLRARVGLATEAFADIK